jgi:hypothetical protein
MGPAGKIAGGPVGALLGNLLEGEAYYDAVKAMYDTPAGRVMGLAQEPIFDMGAAVTGLDKTGREGKAKRKASKYNKRYKAEFKKQKAAHPRYDFGRLVKATHRALKKKKK